MYFWNTKELANTIRDNNFTETDRRNYYIAGTILLYITMYLMAAQPRNNHYLLAIEAILMILVAVVGINCTFQSNGGSLGKDYIARMAALSFPISIKIILASFAFGLLLGVVVATFSLSESYINSSSSAATVFFQCLMFWRLNAAIKYINT